MGANAQTTVPTFTAGDVLTAAQMNQSARTGVPVFAGTVERDAAFGGTGEKTLAEGQLCYLEDANVVQYYDGSNWATVGPATASALVRVGGATFSSTASVSFANSLFTATYNIYYVSFNVTSSSGDQSLSLRVRDDGGAKTAANYTGQSYFIRAGNAQLSTNNTSGATSQVIGYMRNAAGSFGFWVTNPTNAAVRTRWYGQSAGVDNGYDAAANTMFGEYSVNEAHTGLNLFVAGTMTGYYNVYGYSET